jgi:hypothetical protein
MPPAGPAHAAQSAPPSGALNATAPAGTEAPSRTQASSAGPKPSTLTISHTTRMPRGRTASPSADSSAASPVLSISKLSVWASGGAKRAISSASTDAAA